MLPIAGKRLAMTAVHILHDIAEWYSRAEMESICGNRTGRPRAVLGQK